MPNHGPFRALLDGGGNLLDSGGLVVRCCPGDLLSSTVPKLRNLLTHFCTNLLPGASFSCRWFKLKFDRNRRLVSCSDVANMHVSTQNVFSLIFHTALHQVHRHLFCHLLYYPRFLQIRLGNESCDQISASPNRPKRAKSRDKTAGSLFTRAYPLVKFSQTKRCFFSFL